MLTNLRVIKILIIKQGCKLSNYLGARLLERPICFFNVAAFVQSCNICGTTRHACEDQLHLRGTALPQCAREGKLEYSKITHEFYLSTRRQHTLFCKLWCERYCIFDCILKN